MSHVVSGLCAIAIAACVPPGGGMQPAVQTGAQPAEQAPEPAPDTRNEGQVIVDILQTQNYTCAVEEARWTCAVPGSPWAMTVSFVNTTSPTTIWFDSYELRAFGKKCDEFANYLTDLGDTAASFTVSCDDATQAFRFNTAYAYQADADVMAWAASHLAKRDNGLKMLQSVHAIRRANQR